MTITQEEYQKELDARKGLQSEVTRLKVQLSGQSARMAVLTADERTKAMLISLLSELTNRLHALERDVARVKVERDMALAEIEELNLIKKYAIRFSSVASNVVRCVHLSPLPQ